MTTQKLDSFTQAYIEAALWSSTDEHGEPLDGLYTADSLAPECLARIIEDCRSFRSRSGDMIPLGRLEEAAHDFWLTRCGHGCGFWDGDWPDALGRHLTSLCKGFGEFTLYIGDDGLIHGA